MARTLGIGSVLLSLFLGWSPQLQGVHKGKQVFDNINASLQGSVLDFTKNHGCDRRIYSTAMQEKRDLYVYLPPHFDPTRKYPLLLWLHGFAQDEESFLEIISPALDAAIANGQLPPLIAAAPDGSLTGRASLFKPGSFFLNNQAGKFEDFLMVDVWNFLFEHFPLLPERQAHVIAGVSMGGSAAYNKAFKFPDRFGVILGLLPPLNLRWKDCHGRYLTKFDPDCWGWRTDFRRPFEVVAQFGILKIRQGKIVGPLFHGRSNDEITAEVSRQNPIEMLDCLDIRPAQFAMYIGYVGKDEFNINTQVESFLYRARQRGLEIEVCYDPEGHHNSTSAQKFIPSVISWLDKQLAAYKPKPDAGVVLPGSLHQP